MSLHGNEKNVEKLKVSKNLFLKKRKLTRVIFGKTRPERKYFHYSNLLALFAQSDFESCTDILT
jgi:hypothetical protein